MELNVGIIQRFFEWTAKATCCAMQGPSDVAVEEVHAILRQIVARTIESEECKGLAQFTALKREIALSAAGSLETMKDDARKMVQTMVEMESSYLTAEVFREILQRSSSPEGSELIRTLSGRMVRSAAAADHKQIYRRSHFSPIWVHVKLRCAMLSILDGDGALRCRSPTCKRRWRRLPTRT